MGLISDKDISMLTSMLSVEAQALDALNEARKIVDDFVSSRRGVEALARTLYEIDDSTWASLSAIASPAQIALREAAPRLLGCAIATATAATAAATAATAATAAATADVLVASAPALRSPRRNWSGGRRPSRVRAGRASEMEWHYDCGRYAILARTGGFGTPDRLEYHPGGVEAERTARYRKSVWLTKVEHELCVEEGRLYRAGLRAKKTRMSKGLPLVAAAPIK